ncbi:MULTISPECIES: OmpA family protein [Chitinophaga]|uniref:OmpA family protein n=1 Tax=Chitinophaga TaxID=79328 RepID=UPI000DBAD919|nr:OmpA family protein [Chitinophaga ginsengisegetis]MDR6570697.1 outer membrane protein OmpA-like peptidoglycan-associated protein [Chitinophaga ginsengisegetis]MDR6650431.1 outer membrane protein OmpA-like peptidoglycan-associated protein [Chitinophaga ginsengisegetis]MDR6656930.1 outer membrane protein OmpA-like peptidoglycan-associated protein [Chitinophaga ginsengisegetis]
MKHSFFFNLLLITCIGVTSNIYGQKCPGHPLFSNMSNFEVSDCVNREFDKLEFTLNDKSPNGYSVVEKSGEFLEVSFRWLGDFENRPAPVQIYQNYKNAIVKAGGELPDAYNKNSTLYGKIKKGSDTYWLQVYTDGSGYYTVTSVKEGAMRQDVEAITAEQIKKGMKEEGKMAFYGIYFDTDKATIKPESTPSLKEIASFLKADPSQKVFIVGHTDNTGDFQHNLTLSKQRATAIVNELTTKHGVSAGQLTAEGVGPLSPIGSNATEAGKASNRRVELVRR